jgi:hypothetical protein
MDEERFNIIRAGFGKVGKADELCLYGFRSLSDAEADDLIKLIVDFPVKAELRKYRGKTILNPHLIFVILLSLSSSIQFTNQTNCSFYFVIVQQLLILHLMLIYIFR